LEITLLHLVNAEIHLGQRTGEHENDRRHKAGDGEFHRRNKIEDPVERRFAHG